MKLFGSSRRKARREKEDKQRRERRTRIEGLQAKSDQTALMMTTITKKRPIHR